MIDAALDWFQALPVSYQTGILLAGLLVLWLCLMLATTQGRRPR